MLAQLLATELCPEKALHLARGLYRARRFAAARQVLEALPAGRREGRVEMLLGQIAFAARDYSRAQVHLQAARRLATTSAGAERAWFYLSRTLGRLHRDRQAVASHLAMVDRYPRGRFADRALYYAGWLLHNLGDCDGAQPLFTRLREGYPRSRWLVPARWFTALCQLQRRQWRQALETLRPQLVAPNPEVAGRALYWSALAAERLQRKELRARLLHQLAARQPLSWYSLLASARWPRDYNVAARRDAGPPRPLRQRRLEQLVELSHTGLGGWAQALLADESKKKRWRRSPRHLLALADAARRAGDCNLSWRLAAGRGSGNFSGLPEPDDLPWWRASWPACFRDELSRVAVEPSLQQLLLAIMRTESGYDPAAQSLADARGLLQLIDEVARPAAAALAIEYRPERLFEPETNIRLAAWHLRQLLKLYRGKHWLAAAAYNAGVEAVDGWLGKFGDQPADLFAELVPWTETRRYFKRVISAWAHLAFLWGGPAPSLTLEPPGQGGKAGIQKAAR